MYDPAEPRAEVPFIKIPNPDTEPPHAHYRVEFTLRPFSIRVVRKSNSNVV